MNKNILKLAIVGLACVQAPVQANTGRNWSGPAFMAVSALNFYTKSMYGKKAGKGGALVATGLKDAAKSHNKGWVAAGDALILAGLAYDWKFNQRNFLTSSWEGLTTLPALEKGKRKTFSYWNGAANRALGSGMALASAYLSANSLATYAYDQLTSQPAKKK